MRAWILLALLAACSTSPEKADMKKARPATKTLRQAELKIDRVSRIPDPLGLALSVRYDKANPPERLSKDFQKGNNWLHIENPRGFSFAIHDLLRREQVFLPREASFTFAQQRSASSSKRRREPVLLRLEGTIHSDDIAPHLEVVPDPGLEVRGLGSFDNEDIRVLLGRGIDLLIGMAPASAGGTDEYDTREWVALTDGQGTEVDLTDALDEARRAVSLAPLRDHRVIVRRWRPRARPRATFFRVRLEHVLLAAQMAAKRKGGEYSWVWEGLWEGKMQPAPAPIEPPGWEDAPKLTVHYKEYRQERYAGRAFWETLMSPLALGADVGKALFEGESVVDRVTKE
ncbi:MAG: hypothetical protein ACYTGI_03175 [Planctomycetota bacterium]